MRTLGKLETLFRIGEVADLIYRLWSEYKRKKEENDLEVLQAQVGKLRAEVMLLKALQAKAARSAEEKKPAKKKAPASSQKPRK